MLKITFAKQIVMNVLITSNDPYPQFIGGDKRVALILAKEWKWYGHEVFFLCYSPSPLRKAEVEGIEQLFFPDNNNLFSESNLSFFSKTIMERKVQIVLHQHPKTPEFNKLCFALHTLVKIISVVHFDIAHEEKVLARSFFVRMRNGSNIKRWIIDGLLYVKYLLFAKRKQHSELVRLYTDIYDHSDCVALLSSSCIDSFITYVPYANRGKLWAVNNPIKPIEYIPTIPKEKIVLWVGRLDMGAKRVDYMLRIWREINQTHSDWQLKILGSGDWDYWRSIIVSYDIKNAEIVGFCNPSEYYAKASILCMTSVTEGWGMVLVEAQQYGCVPMAYRSYAALDEIITDGENGYNIKAFDQKEYVTKLRRLMNDSELRHRMAIQGLENVKRLHVDKIAKTWISHFESML